MILLRHLFRQKLNSSIHIIGLTLAMATCLLIGLWIKYQTSYDSYHADADRIYRVISDWERENSLRHHPHTPLVLATTLRNEATELDHVVRVHPRWNCKIEVNEHRSFMEKNVFIVEPEYVDVFSVNVISGNARQALSTPYHAVLTESTARKFYGSDDPIGKTFKFRQGPDITVGAVIRDLPANTNYPASMLLAFVDDKAFLDNRGDGDWSVTGAGPGEWRSLTTSTFIKVSPDFNPLRFNALLARFADKYINVDPAATAFMKGSLSVQPISDIHLNKELTFGASGAMAIDASWVMFFGWIGAAVLILACANFVNLSAAQALARAAEVGIRKAAGASRRQLVFQFLSEAWILALVSGAIAVTAAWAALPWINSLLETGIDFQPIGSPVLVIGLLLCILLIGSLAGLYPAWIISRFNPALSLRTGLTKAGNSGSVLIRKILLIVQFSVSSGLVFAVVLFARQASYMSEKDLGFNKENVITLPAIGSDERKGSWEVFANSVRSIPGVKAIAFSDKIPGLIIESNRMSTVGSDDPNKFGVSIVNASPEYFSLYDLKLVAGRRLTETDYIIFKEINFAVFIPEFSVVVNRQLVKELGLGTPEEAIGKMFVWSGGPPKIRIVGVVEDFNSGSLYTKVGPLFFTALPSGFNETSIRLEEGASIHATLDAIEVEWNRTFGKGTKVFSFRFLDEQLDEIYKSDARLNTLFRGFAGLAIIISCFGLWGLIAYSAKQRTKEIGIRKVLGASVRAIIALLTREFVLIVSIALLIAFPLSWYFMNDWLGHFVYRVSIGWSVFVFAGGMLMTIALLTMIVQALKAALANPVNALRNE